MREPELRGFDFTSAPRARKPITLARGWLRPVAGGPPRVRLEAVEKLHDFDAFDAALAAPGPWLGVFDLPFGLPRELVVHLGWPTRWDACIERLASHSRGQLRDAFRAFCAPRAPGGKFARRATDGPAGSSPSMKWVNPPVAWMLHAGAPRLLRAGVTIPGVRDGDPARVALEGYPALLARAVTRMSYKSDDRARQTPARRAQRARIVAALNAGAHPCGIALECDAALEAAMCDDPSGDVLDASLCLVFAAWAELRRGQGFGLPSSFDPLEGWIVGARADAP